MVACRTDDCCVAQETRSYPDMVVREAHGEDQPDSLDPFALMTDWDQAAPDTRRFGWIPAPLRPRPELVATRWSARGLKAETYRDDPPA